ncbi:hypothetical protein E8E13_002662 [Curvularia kusanoi]|uniref:Major facilitator superfamily (MFS) profile domain-containing protein n=1 Tax=Curvularia kusanoi TaxID=90978 RepID=A0A9P4T6F6_CURKU|nr:hypothetical protein E8E13_002662 [Curvularia kusanoi]
MIDNAHWSSESALLLSAGFGIINFVFAFPAIWTIDTFGRRNLLLFTFPLLALFQLISVVAFAIPEGVVQRALAIVGMYLFGIAYSPGEGPVPFVYSAESMPLYNRDYGMGIVTAINWMFNFIVSFTWPTMSGKDGMGPSEELDVVFERPTRDYMRHGMAQLRWFVKYHVLRQEWEEKNRPRFLQPVETNRPHDPRGDFDSASEKS